ncbi:hypothetical protein IIB79_06360 [candidate division KSB1 bacterium]|nr:hypothetical protein [candidate division KSB1 bacterium]
MKTYMLRFYLFFAEELFKKGDYAGMLDKFVIALWAFDCMTMRCDRTTRMTVFCNRVKRILTKRTGNKI